MAKRKPLSPKVKRMKRAGRLASAKTWLPTFTGKNVLRGYCNHFGVDWRCAAGELKILGVQLDSAYLAQREKTEAETVRKRKETAERSKSEADQHWHPCTEPFEAYLAGDYPLAAEGLRGPRERAKTLENGTGAKPGVERTELLSKGLSA